MHDFEHWLKVGETNEVARDFRAAEEMVDLVEKGFYPVCWMSGPGGVGKSFTMQGAVARWKAAGLDPVFLNPHTYRDVQEAYKQSRGKRPIIMEEADVVFRSDKCLNLLKIATDRGGSGIYDGARVRAPLIVTTNKPLDAASFKAEHRAHIAALFNRVPPITITFDRFHNWQYSIYLALTTDLVRFTRKRDQIALKTVARALEWFTSNATQIELLSPRTLQNVAEWMHVLSPLALDQMLKTVLGPTLPGSFPQQDWGAILVDMIERRRGDEIAAKPLRDAEIASAKRFSTQLEAARWLTKRRLAGDYEITVLAEGKYGLARRVRAITKHFEQA